MAERFAGLRRDAVFVQTDYGRYRLKLERSWGLHQRTVVCIGLNPSTADNLTDDPTIRAMYGHCESWDRERLIMLNLFTLIATEPKDLLKSEYPECGGSLDVWKEYMERPEKGLLVVAAWGAHGTFMQQDRKAMAWLDYWGIKAMCLGTNDNGTPKHPLYIARGTKLVPYYGRPSGR